MKCNNMLLTQDMRGDMLIRHIILCMLASDPRGWIQLRLYGGLLARCNGGQKVLYTCRFEYLHNMSVKLNELSASRQLQYVSMYTDMSNNLYNVGCNLVYISSHCCTKHSLRKLIAWNCQLMRINSEYKKNQLSWLRYNY